MNFYVAGAKLAGFTLNREPLVDEFLSRVIIERLSEIVTHSNVADYSTNTISGS